MQAYPDSRIGRAEPVTATYLHMLGAKSGIPVGGTFELTSRCNFNCRMCYVHGTENPELLISRELTAERWLSVASDARDSGMVFLLLTGGEPFIRSDFAEIYTGLCKMGFIISVNTNGSLYNDGLRTLFRQFPPSRFNVTLYGASNDTYRNLCGNASYDAVIANIRQMREDGFQVKLNVSLTPCNVCDINEIDRISRELHLQVQAGTYMYPPVRKGNRAGENGGRFTPEDAGKYQVLWQKLRDTPEQFAERRVRLQNRESAGVNGACEDREQMRCRAGRTTFWITWDGRMMPCGTMSSEGFSVPELGFKAAWEQTKAYADGIRLPAECSSCEYRANCAVCASVCKGETGGFESRPDYFCRMTKSIICHTLADETT